MMWLDHRLFSDWLYNQSSVSTCLWTGSVSKVIRFYHTLKYLSGLRAQLFTRMTQCVSIVFTVETYPSISCRNCV